MINPAIQKADRFIQQMNALFGRIKLDNFISNSDDFFDLLLSKDIEDVNKYIRQLSARTLGSCRSVRCINARTLYVVFCDGTSDSLLGSEFLSPEIKIPTFHQLHEEHRWYKKTGFKPRIAQEYETLDRLVEARISYVLKLIGFLQRMLEHGISPWEYVFLSVEGQRIQGELLKDVKQKIVKVREDIATLKKLHAPLFMQEEYRKDLEKYKIIAGCLSKTTHL